MRIPDLSLACLLAVASCHRPAGPPAHSDNLRPVGEHVLKVPEPSDLSLSPDGSSLWMVSDEDGNVYRTDLKGAILSSFATGHRDLEGIAAVGADKVAVLAERARKLLVFSVDGTLLREKNLEIPGKDNSGPEALAWNDTEREFYVIKEKNPGLFLVLDEELKERSRTELRFARDYSGMFYERAKDRLWISSDESGAVYVLDKNLRLRNVFSLAVPQIEGVAVDHDRRRLYLVSDPEAKLYVYEFDER